MRAPRFMLLSSLANRAGEITPLLYNVVTQEGMKLHQEREGKAKVQMLLLFTVLAIGVGIGAFVRPFFDETSTMSTITGEFSDVRQNTYDNGLTNPLLECRELPESISIGERIGLQQEIERIIAKHKAEKSLTDASVYFRDLNNGPWFGVEEDKKFYPASLIKVPLAMYYYWKADTDPGILTQEIDFTGPRGTSIVHFPPPELLEEAKIYTVEDLISKMLRYSDNDAAFILDSFAGNEKDVVYHDLGVDAGRAGEEYSIDVRTYASFFRILFNATYLTRSLSEHMLATLVQSSFTQGIVAGVPEGVKVAHKFGEKVLNTNDARFQLHDCGIVYIPNQPYTLCIMTQGKDLDRLAAIIAEISATVYKEVTNTP